MQIAKRSVSVGRNRVLLLAAIPLIMAGGCNRAGDEPSGPLTIHLMSTSIVDGVLNKAITCDGQGLSPQLSWSAPPPKTQGLALVVTDRDSPSALTLSIGCCTTFQPARANFPLEFRLKKLFTTDPSRETMTTTRQDMAHLVHQGKLSIITISFSMLLTCL
jgi:Phosphatidylethanolamine-binding protein